MTDEIKPMTMVRDTELNAHAMYFIDANMVAHHVKNYSWILGFRKFIGSDKVHSASLKNIKIGSPIEDATFDVATLPALAPKLPAPAPKLPAPAPKLPAPAPVPDLPTSKPQPVPVGDLTPENTVLRIKDVMFDDEQSLVSNLEMFREQMSALNKNMRNINNRSHENKVDIEDLKNNIKGFGDQIQAVDSKFDKQVLVTEQQMSALNKNMRNISNMAHENKANIEDLHAADKEFVSDLEKLREQIKEQGAGDAKFEKAKSSFCKIV
jgi:hypothetical protein